MPERDPVTAFRLTEDAAFARHGVTVAEHSLDLGGRTVRVLESGDGPPIVLVPGDGAVAGAWAPLMAELPGHRVIVLDRPGAGLSGAFDRRAGDLRDQAVGLLTATLDALGLERVPIVGSSGGAAWALWTAIATPGRVGAVAALGMPGVCLPGVRPSVAALFQASMRPGGRPRATCVIGDDELRALDVPVLFVFGADEPLGGPEVVRRAAGLMPHARVEVVPGAWHHPWLADAPAVGRLVAGLARRP
jgi:pimeloyl-ACP methyl ester carboxylesterase